MRLILTCLLLFVKGVTYAQFSDNFADGELLQNPFWFGMIDHFEVDTSKRLHLKAPANSDTSYLVTNSSSVLGTKWEFKVNLDFNPSSANYTRIYLSSSQSDLRAALNGYFVQVGHSDDEVSLYRQDGVMVTEMIDGLDGVTNTDSVGLRVKVICNDAGVWSLYTDATGGVNYVNQGNSVFDVTYSTSLFFGIYCQYTSSRSDRFYFDDLQIGQANLNDLIPPSLVTIEVVDAQTLSLYFSELLWSETAENEFNFHLSHEVGTPLVANLNPADASHIRLSFAKSFPPFVELSLSFQNIEDLAGNQMTEMAHTFSYEPPDETPFKAVVISEIMCDPSPSIGLPEAEYIELFNRTDDTIDLSGWTISDEITDVVFGEMMILPQAYALCCLPGFGDAYGLENVYEFGLPSLNNEGDGLVLSDAAGQEIDAVNYQLDWYKDNDKAGGGWSLELMDLNFLCTTHLNWQASHSSKGGTPGKQNTTYVSDLNLDLPSVKGIYVVDDTLVHICFDQPVGLGQVSIEPMVNYQVKVLESETLILSCFGLAINQIYGLTLSGFTSCSGEALPDYTGRFGLPAPVSKGDLLINEVLFNPESGSDYVELVNVSNKIIALDDVRIGNAGPNNWPAFVKLSAHPYLMFPEEYLVVTEDSVSVKSNFPHHGIGVYAEVNLPHYNNDSGTVVLMNEGMELIDEFSYSEKMHFKLIENPKGKALERLSLDAPTKQLDNWYTASENIDWGTPGLPNSHLAYHVAEGGVTLDRAIFSPDNDGYQDFLTLNYTFDEPEHVLDVEIYDVNGRLIKRLKDNFYAGQSGVLIWDGTTDADAIAKQGTYIILVRAFHLNGTVHNYRLVGVLASKL